MPFDYMMTIYTITLYKRDWGGGEAGREQAADYWYSTLSFSDYGLRYP